MKGWYTMMKSGFLTAKGSVEFWLTRSASGNYIVSVEPYGKEKFNLCFHTEKQVKESIKSFEESELNY